MHPTSPYEPASTGGLGWRRGSESGLGPSVQILIAKWQPIWYSLFMMDNRPEYAAWWSARNRCHNPKDKYYHLYGARGIQMCERWRTSFQAFLADMGPRPQA